MSILQAFADARRTVSGQKKEAMKFLLVELAVTAICLAPLLFLTESGSLKYLAALRFALPGQEYKDYIAEHPEMEEVARELEAAAATAEKEWRNGSAGRQVKRLQGYLRGGQGKSFDNYAQLRVRELRDAFRADNAPSF